MPLLFVREDITAMQVDAIVNAANSALKMGGGVCGAIFAAAGARELQEECNSIGFCETGKAVLTNGHRLRAKYVIHTVGPIWRGGTDGEEALLSSCYASALALAAGVGCESVAFPLISSGIYGYPKEQAFRIAVSAIMQFLRDSDMTVYLSLFGKLSILPDDRYLSVQAYLDLFCQERSTFFRRLERSDDHPQAAQPLMAAPGVERRLSELMSGLDETFSQMLLRLIDQKGKTDVETYKRANIDRKLFSKIRSNPQYSPSKATAVALCVALELNLDETRDLLSRAGYTLSRCSKFDVIVEYFIREGDFDTTEINEALFAFSQPLLGD